MSHWAFNALKPGDTIRNPISDDFFSQDAIEDASEALVREAVQNCLDAGLEGTQVRVTFRIVSDLGRPAQGRIAELLAGLQADLAAQGNGLLDPPPVQDCERYAVIEDFGTTGLRGDPSQWHPIDGVKNDFFAFFRAEGYSAKQGEDRGRWGVGKTVFPRSSQINAFFGLTVPADTGQPLLMGRCILRTHEVNGVTRVADGYFGEWDDGLARPTTDSVTLGKFESTFELTPRCPGDSGLSVVVPFLDDGVTAHTLLRACIRDYFHPLLTGALSIRIESNDDRWELNTDTIRLLARDHEDAVGSDMLPVLDLAHWALLEDPERITIPSPEPDGAASWSVVELSESMMAKGRAALEESEKQAFRVDLWVRPKGAAPIQTYFDVFLAAAGNQDKCRPVYVRDGIVISNACGVPVAGRHALVVIDHLPLATLLGDAENVAHTEWNKDRSLFQQKYVYAKSYLGFLRAAPAKLVHLFSADEEERDPVLLADLLSVEIPDLAAEEGPHAGSRGREKRRTNGQGSGPERLRRFRIDRSEAGFTISPGDPNAPQIENLDVAMAYDLRGGNPMRSWSPADFDIGSDSISVIAEGSCELVSCNGNRIRLAVSGPDYKLSVSGFDAKRDLLVRAEALNAVDGHDNA
jgi:hypothetical protein